MTPIVANPSARASAMAFPTVFFAARRPSGESRPPLAEIFAATSGPVTTAKKLNSLKQNVKHVVLTANPPNASAPAVPGSFPMNAVSTAPITGSNNSSANPGNANARIDASNSHSVSSLGGRLSRHSTHSSQSLRELATRVPPRVPVDVDAGVARAAAAANRAPRARVFTPTRRAPSTHDTLARARGLERARARVPVDAIVVIAPIRDDE